MSDHVIIDNLWAKASAAHQRNDFTTAAELFGQIITLLEAMLPAKPPDYPGHVLQDALTNAFYNQATCLLETCGHNINSATHALIRSTIHGNGYPPARQNLLYVINLARNYHQNKLVTLPDESRFRQIAKWHNEGYRLLKEPLHGSSDRDWDGAIRCFDNVLKLDQNWTPSLHLMGMVYEGLANKRRRHGGDNMMIEELETKAVNSWIQVKAIDYDFNFELRIKFEFE